MALMKSVKQFDVHWVSLDPTLGSEIRKTRPCIIISPDEMNELLKTVVVIPLTSTIIDWPFRCNIKILGKQSSVTCDQIRTVSTQRLLKKAGRLSTRERDQVLHILQAMFSV